MNLRSVFLAKEMLATQCTWFRTARFRSAGLVARGQWNLRPCAREHSSAKCHGLSFAAAQRLCNVNFETEVAFMATVGPRDNEEIVGSACYFLNPCLSTPAKTLYASTGYGT
jgi:hypothetical protein